MNFGLPCFPVLFVKRGDRDPDSEQFVLTPRMTRHILY